MVKQNNCYKFLNHLYNYISKNISVNTWFSPASFFLMKISSILCTVALSSGIDFNLTNQRITLKSKRNFPIRLSCELLRRKNLYICLTYKRTSAVKWNLTLSVAKIFSSWLREGTKNGFWIMVLPRWYQKVPGFKKVCYYFNQQYMSFII